MSMKIEVSFEETQELDKALEYLRPIIRSYKVKKAENGANKRYNKAYIKCLELPQNARKN